MANETHNEELVEQMADKFQGSDAYYVGTIISCLTSANSKTKAGRLKLWEAKHAMDNLVMNYFDLETGHDLKKENEQ